MRYRLSCVEMNARHTRFTLWDGGEPGARHPQRVNCGTITILTEDVLRFIQLEWNGEVAWNGLHPPIRQTGRPEREVS